MDTFILPLTCDGKQNSDHEYHSGSRHRGRQHQAQRKLLFDIREFDARTCAELVKWSDKRFGCRLESLSGWMQDVRDFLESATACEPERPCDFAWPDNVNCACPQCAQLRAFLGNPKRETAEIQALKAQLEHVQNQIRHDKLDATAKLDRSTRPFTLQLTKTQGSYERAVTRFQQDLKRLATLPS